MRAEGGRKTGREREKQGGKGGRERGAKEAWISL